jgi:peptidoglycan-associated lipoprotein
MKILKSVLLIALLSVLSIGSVSAQDVLEKNKLCKLANQLYNQGEYFTAIAEYKKAYSKTKDKAQKAEITYRIANSYSKSKQPKKAVQYFAKCKKMKYTDEHPIVLLQMAEAYKTMAEYEDAMTNFNLYKNAVPADKRGANGAKSCELAIAWTDKPTRYKVTNMAVLNSRQNDVGPAYGDKKHKTLVFASSRDDATGSLDEQGKTGQSMLDLYTATLDKKGKWSKPTNEPFLSGDEAIDTKAGEAAPSFNSRVNTIYFTRCGMPKKDGVEYCMIFQAKKMGKGFAAPTKAIVVDSANVSHSSLSLDGKTMYFVADLPGGYGGYDVWSAEYDKKARTFINPVNLGPQINTEKNEIYPFMHDDGTLYFSSNGHIGMGGYDVFKVEPDGAGWGPVVNMKCPINSAGDDVSVIFEGAKEKGYLSSSRAGGKGSLDLYSFVLPKLEFMVQGVVKDAGTQAILPNSLVKLVGSDGATLEATTDDAGAYSFKLSAGTNYTLAAKNDSKKKNGKQLYFASGSKMITTVSVEESKTYQLDFLLESLPETPIVLPNILYLTNDTTLLPESKIALNRLVNILNENSNFVIKIMSHTDFRGTTPANQILSRGRANSVVKFLVDEKGIEAARLQAEGKGESAPRTITETTAEDFAGICKSFNVKMEDYFKVGDVMKESVINALKSKDAKLAAHQFNRRTEFEIIGEDYVSPSKTVGEEAPKN